MVDTTLSPPVEIKPPFRETPQDQTGAFSQPWNGYFTDISDRVADLTSRVTLLEARRGVTDGSDAAAGQIGEYLSAFASGPLAPSVATDLITLTLPAGDWDVAGSTTFAPTTALLEAHTWLSIAAGTPQDPGRMVIVGNAAGTGTLSGTGLVVGPVRHSVTAPATLVVYLGALAQFTTGTVTANVWIRARRVR